MGLYIYLGLRVGSENHPYGINILSNGDLIYYDLQTSYTSSTSTSNPHPLVISLSDPSPPLSTTKEGEREREILSSLHVNNPLNYYPKHVKENPEYYINNNPNNPNNLDNRNNPGGGEGSENVSVNRSGNYNYI